MLTLSNLAVSYDGSRILRGVSLAVERGRVHCLMGRNGVGKTTLLKSTMGLVRADQGSVMLDGQELSPLRTDDRARVGLGYVPQGREIFPNLSVRENLELGAMAHGRRARTDKDRVFALFPVLRDMIERKGGLLSGGQQQQLAIGRALLTNPKVLLLDEPTEGIQPSIIDQIGDTIKRLRSRDPEPDADQRFEEIGTAIKALRREGGIGILLVEQYLEFCVEVGDNFSIMDRGNIVAGGPMAELCDAIVKEHLTV